MSSAQGPSKVTRHHGRQHCPSPNFCSKILTKSLKTDCYTMPGIPAARGHMQIALAGVTCIYNAHSLEQTEAQQLETEMPTQVPLHRSSTRGSPEVDERVERGVDGDERQRGGARPPPAREGHRMRPARRLQQLQHARQRVCRLPPLRKLQPPSAAISCQVERMCVVPSRSGVLSETYTTMCVQHDVELHPTTTVGCGMLGPRKSKK